MKENGKLHYFLHMIRTKVMLLFAGIMILLLLLLLTFGWRMEQRFVEQLVDANRGLLRYYAGVMESEFSAAELFFTEQRLQQSRYLQIENAENELDRYLAAYAVRQVFDNSLYETECLDLVFLYSPENETLVQCSYGLEDVAERTLTDLMCELIEAGQVQPARWIRLPVGGTVYLAYILPIHNSWVGGLVDTGTLLEKIETQEIENLQSVILLDESFRPLSGAFDPREAAAVQEAAAQGCRELTLRGEDYILSRAEGSGGCCLLGLTERDLLQGRMGNEGVLLLAGAAALLVLGVGLLLLLWRSLVRPLSNITQGMLELQKGNFSYQLKEEKSSEFAQITTTFNTVGHEIEQLKIHVYEERLERQKTELQFLQSQLNPHFLINCLNNLRTLVLQERLPEFQTMLIELGIYLRGTMTMQRLIPLEQEIKNVTAYVHLQKLRYQDRFQVELQLYEELLPIPVPVHIIQTFVENAIKYGLSEEGPLSVRVTGDLADEGGTMLLLTVEDDGPGFPAEMLEQVEWHEGVIRDGRVCIGIANAARRLRLQFGERASLVCSNRAEGGACVRLEIPVEEGEL